MIIYTDLFSGDEMLSDTYNINVAADCPILWETDCRKYTKKVGEDFELAGANPSAEDAAEEQGEGEFIMVHDIEDQFRLNWLKVEDGAKPSKEDFKAWIKSYLRKLMKKLEEIGTPAEEIAEFKANAPKAMKKLIANYDNYDVLMGQSMNPDSMYVLIDFREDGVTPYATVFKHGFASMKV
ncbi:Translationally-controlled tumor protein [Penicillium verhagenii]|nr:Translationally-controlled tumor protein [Penicillium verhagenii]